MANWVLPTVTDLYTNIITYFKDRDLDLAKGLDPAVVTVTNPVANMIRWASANNRWEKYNGTTWAALSTTFDLNGPIGGTTPATGAFTTVTGTSFNSITGLSSTTPAALGTAAVGVATTAARADHVHSSSLASGTGLPLTTGVTGTLPIANGGTNSTATPTAGGVTYGTGTAQAYTAAGSAGQVLTSGGAGAPTWSTVALTVAVVSTTTQAAVANSHYILTNVAATTVTLPASPASGDTVWITVANSLATNVIARNAQTIMGLAEDLTINAAYSTVQLRFVNSSWRIL